MSKLSRGQKALHFLSAGLTLSLGLFAIWNQAANAEGSRNLFPSGAPGNRANLEWRTELVGNLIYRRTLLKVYADTNEYILVGSSAVGVGLTTTSTDKSDIYIYNTQAMGQVGSETFGVPSFKCSSQSGRGMIGSRTQELAGPQNIVGTGNLTGYKPCYYKAPVAGIYDVVIFGPSGFTSSGDGSPTAEVALTGTGNFNADQGTSVAAWDVTVRNSTTSVADIKGRLFSYYLALFTGSNGRPISPTIYPVTTDGYIYKTELRGLDPNGFTLYGNEVGFFDSDGKSSLYHDIVGDGGQVSNPQGGVKLSRPQFPTFFSYPDSATLGYINRFDRNGNLVGTGITTFPIVPAVNNFQFAGSLSGNTSVYSNGGTFKFSSSVTGSYEIVVKGSGSSDFSPTNPKNRVLRGDMITSGSQTVVWNGKDNSGAYFPIGTNYPFVIRIRGGEYHFPLLDAENNPSGGPTITLMNPPTSYPSDLPGFGATTGFYDDRVYKTIGGTIVNTGATQTDINNNKALCGINPPTITFSNPITGFDTKTSQRAYGQSGNVGNANTACASSGSFGDTKGLDQWTFFPSSTSSSVLNVAASSSPNVLLVKRITKINQSTTTAAGKNLAAYVDDLNSSNDNNSTTVHWPDLNANGTPDGFLVGGMDGGLVKPNDEVEYTVYFLSAGTTTAKSVQLCDRIPPNQTFVFDAFNSLATAPNAAPNYPVGDRGIAVSQSGTLLGYTNLGDDDIARYYPPGSVLPSACTQPVGSEDNGTIVVNLGDLPNATTSGTAGSYGYLRFRAKVK